LKEDEKNRLVSVLQGKAAWPPPVWLMRQAGRYLPEYRALRAKAGSFWAMCMDPAMAAEVTLQPIRRFGLDAAILFSDILVVPFALGRKVEFEEGTGPSMQPVSSADGLERSDKVWSEKLSPVYESLGRVRAELDNGTALLGFAGAPWTLVTYMAEGRGSTDQQAAKRWAYRDPESFGRLIDLLADCVAFHLIRQLEAGADAVQIFDSWAGGLPEAQFARWVAAPTKRIVEHVRAAKPDAKIIGFPRAATLAGYELFARETGVNAISVDTAAPLGFLRKMLGDKIVIQGNLDPQVLVVGGKALDESIDAILAAMKGAPFIFNLGHGVLPETPPEHVAQLVARVRAQ
jgi:uroporphyrinogen decarboxylase